MAVFEQRFHHYLLALLGGERGKGYKDTWQYDPILALLMPEITRCNNSSFHIDSKEAAAIVTNKDPIIAFKIVHGMSLNSKMSIETERRIVSLKLGFPHLPATTVTKILQGFGEELEYEDILKVFASHGLSHIMRKAVGHRDFVEINRRAAGWFHAIENIDGNIDSSIRIRFQAIKDWLKADKGKKGDFFKCIPMKQSLFFHWWTNFQRLGLLGLATSGPQLFHKSK